jgi:hypothetical protein
MAVRVPYAAIFAATAGRRGKGIAIVKVSRKLLGL